MRAILGSSLAAISCFAANGALAQTTVGPAKQHPKLPNDGIINGDFSLGKTAWHFRATGPNKPAGLLWTTPPWGVIAEEHSQKLSLWQDFRLPKNPIDLVFEVAPQFDRASATRGDWGAVSLLDPKTGKSLVPTWDTSVESFLRLHESQAARFGAKTTLTGTTVRVDLAAVAGERIARLQVDVIGGDDDTRGLFRVGKIRVSNCTSSPILTKAPPGRSLQIQANTTADFEIEFAASQFEIAELNVDAGGLLNFTTTKPSLGKRASIRARFAPDHDQRIVNYPIKFTAVENCTPASRTEVTIRLTVVEYGCGLLLGGTRTNVDLGNGDYLLVQPALTYLVTFTRPSFAIPNDPGLRGVKLFAQAFMGSPDLRTKDPLVMSNALQVVLGKDVTPYGSDKHMLLTATGPPLLGRTLTFDMILR